MLANLSEHVSCPKGLMFGVLEGGGFGGRSFLLIYINFGVDVPTKPSVLQKSDAKNLYFETVFCIMS